MSQFQATVSISQLKWITLSLYLSLQRHIYTLFYVLTGNASSVILFSHEWRAWDRCLCLTHIELCPEKTLTGRRKITQNDSACYPLSTLSSHFETISLSSTARYPSLLCQCHADNTYGRPNSTTTTTTTTRRIMFHTYTNNICTKTTFNYSSISFCLRWSRLSLNECVHLSSHTTGAL